MRLGGNQWRSIVNGQQWKKFCGDKNLENYGFKEIKLRSSSMTW